MALETLFTDAMAHTASGIALSLLDFTTSKVANPKTVRLEHKKRCLVSIERLLDTENPQQQIVTEEDESSSVELQILSKDSIEYAEHIAIVRNYLQSSGLVKLQLPFVQRMKNGVKNLIFYEKINNLSNLQKLGVAIGVEVLYDTLFGFYYYTSILKQSPVAAIAVNLYQIPAFWLGLWLGNGIKKFIDVIITPGEEKKVDRTIQQLLQETNIVKIIVSYQPPESIQRSLAEKGLEIYTSQLTRVGQGAFQHFRQLAETAKDAADDVLKYPQKQTEKREKEREQRRKRFDDLTKGH